MFDQILALDVVEARREAIRHADRTIGLAQKQRSGIRGDRTAFECCHHFTPFDGCKSENIRGSLFASRSPRIDGKLLLHNHFR
jgi:hypothetical protein